MSQVVGFPTPLGAAYFKIHINSSSTSFGVSCANCTAIEFYPFTDGNNAIGALITNLTKTNGTLFASTPGNYLIIFRGFSPDTVTI